MKTLDECYDIINNLNERAHSLAYHKWLEADKLADEGEDEDDWVTVEELREEASELQQEHFGDLFHELDQEIQDACWVYRKEDKDFRIDFDCWYGYTDS